MMDPYSAPIPRYSGDRIVPNGLPVEVMEDMAPRLQNDKVPNIRIMPSPIKVAADMARAMEGGNVMKPIVDEAPKTE